MYIIRLDDASEHWNREKWHRLHSLLQNYGIKPIIAIIPVNKDMQLARFPVDEEFVLTINRWIGEGWTPAMHGYEHRRVFRTGGINPVHLYSEFAGGKLSVQKEKIREGYEILLETGIRPKVFSAPFHTFDQNTLIALREETDIRCISDTIARDVYYKENFYYIPQQAGSVRNIKLPIVTFCYHPNYMDDKAFQDLEMFLKKNQSDFISFDKVVLRKRHYDILDGFLKIVYFTMRRNKRTE